MVPQALLGVAPTLNLKGNLMVLRNPVSIVVPHHLPHPVPLASSKVPLLTLLGLSFSILVLQALLFVSKVGVGG